MSDRKRMKKIREKRIEAVDKQILSHEKKIKNEKPPKDTTLEYWRKEIEEKFKKIKEEDKKYIEEKKNKKSIGLKPEVFFKPQIWKNRPKGRGIKPNLSNK